jgi:serine protease Do
MNDVTPANAHFFHLSEASGAIVAQVTPDSPASRAGLKNGDVIDQLNGQKMPNGSALQMAIADVPPGTKVQLGILRSGHPQTIDLTVGEYHANSQVADNDNKDADGTAGHEGKLGLAMSDITPDVRQQLNLPDNVKGVAIRSVRPGSPAEDAGLQPGDVVVQVNRHDVDSASQALASVRSIPAGQDVLLLVWSNGGESYRVLHPDQG